MKRIILIIVLIALTFAQENCRYASKFTREELINSKEKRDLFFDYVSFYEGKFHQHGVGVNLKSGMTYDGISLYLLKRS